MAHPGNHREVEHQPVCYLKEQFKAGVAQLVEHQLPKLRVASSSLVSRSLFFLKALKGVPYKSDYHGMFRIPIIAVNEFHLY